MRKISNEVALGLFIVVAAILLAYMSVTVGGLRLGKGIEVEAVFDSAAGIVKDASVQVAGVEVGRVRHLKVDHDKAIVTLFIQQEAEIRQDVIAAIRAKSLLGEKYIELIPQTKTASLLENGQNITRTQTPLEIDELVTSLRPLIAKVDPNDVQRIVHGVAELIENPSTQMAVKDASVLLAALKTTVVNNQTQIQRTVRNLDKLTQEANALIATQKAPIQRIVANTDKLIAPLSRQSEQLAGRIDRITHRLDTMTAKLGDSSPDLVERLNRLSITLDKHLPATLERTPKTLDNVNSLVGKLEKTLDQLEPALALLNEKEIKKLLQKDGIKVNFF